MVEHFAVIYTCMCCALFCRRASGQGERGETEVQAEAGRREQRLPRPRHPPSSQKAMWVHFGLFLSRTDDCCRCGWQLSNKEKAFTFLYQSNSSTLGVSEKKEKAIRNVFILQREGTFFCRWFFDVTGEREKLLSDSSPGTPATFMTEHRLLGLPSQTLCRCFISLFLYSLYLLCPSIIKPISFNIL